MQELKIRNGSRIAIVGAGPAGTFFAHFALKLARQRIEEAQKSDASINLVIYSYRGK